MEDWASLVGNVGGQQYVDRIAALQDRGINTSAIEKLLVPQSKITNRRPVAHLSYLVNHRAARQR